MIKQHLKPDGLWDFTQPSAFSTMTTPFSQGWRVGNLVFTSGQVPLDEQGQVVGVGDVQMQLRKVMENLRLVLNEAGADFKDVIRLNSFIVYDGPDSGLADFWEPMTRIRAEYFEAPGPAMRGMPIPRLAHPDVLVEIDAIAVVPEGR